MEKHSFYNDYSEGCHPSLLKMLSETNLVQQTGYGLDEYSQRAKEKILTAIGDKGADVHFVSAGTQANLICLAAMTKSYESIIAAESGHINVHEAGGIEATGHKINTVSTPDGKLNEKLIDSVVKAHTDEHMVKPKVVFISNSTELGTIYKKAELKKISDYCRKNNLYLYVDGARLGSALTSQKSDITLKDIAAAADIFYIGGTKNGALGGEAIVIVNKELRKNFRYHLKQRGALLAKGRLVSVQFLALFTDNLYFDLAKHANDMANKLADGIKKLGFKFLTEPESNQIFPILPNTVIEKMKKMYGFYVWDTASADHSAIRLVTSWATKEENVKEFLSDLKKHAF